MRARIFVAAAIGLITCLSCFSDRDATTGPVTGGDCTIPASAFGTNRAVVIMRNFTFASDTVRIRPGGTVTWVNCEPPNIDPHTSTSQTGVWDSSFLQPGDIFARTFATAGTFLYFCVPHPSMRGVVIVQ